MITGDLDRQREAWEAEISGAGGGSTSKWSALGTTTTVINGADVAPTLKNLGNNANKLGAEFDNSDAANRAQYADFELLCRFTSAPTAGNLVKLWLIPALDGTNYADGGDSVVISRPPDDQFYVNNVSTQQRLTVRGVLLPPTKFKPLIRNESGVAHTNVDAENLLRMRTYNEVTV